jgi:TRAP-type C4-dicarboxylate transport system substrate-binding protein
MNTPRKAAVAALLLALAVPARAAAKYKINWYIGHPTLDYFDEAANTFKKAVEAGSRGDIEVSIIKAGPQDGTSRSPSLPEVASMVERGEAQMGHSFADVLGPVVPQLYAFEAPYLFRDYRHMEGVLEGPVGAKVLDGFRAHHIRGLSYTFSGGASGVASDRELRRPEDLKGLKVGVYGDAVNGAWLESLGAKPVAFGHDLGRLQALKRSGAIDAVVITWRNFEQAALQQDFSSLGLLGSTYLVSVTYINEKFFAGLPEAYRALIVEKAREASRVERAKTVELNELARRDMLAKGVTAVELPQDGRARFEQALRPSYASIEKLLGPGLVESIRAAADGPESAATSPDLAYDRYYR